VSQTSGAAPAQLFGHPRGLATLFFTEMWERFTYYGMRALLVLFLVAAVTEGGFGIDDRTATAIYGLYTAAVYLAALPGGWIADRLIGAQRAIIAGAALICLGNGILAVSGTPKWFYAGLTVIVLGVGLLKPNVSTIVAELYPEGGARRDAGFSIFYMGINLGAFIGPLVTGWARLRFGSRAGFAAAGLCMALGLLQFLWTRHHLHGSGSAPHARPGEDLRAQARRGWRQLWIGTGLLVVLYAAVTTGLVAVNPVSLAQATSYLILAMAGGYFVYYLGFAGLDPDDRRRGVVMLVLFIGSAMFWSGYEQAGSSLNLFAERFTDRHIASLGFTIPTEWFQSVNAIFILIFAPVFAALWINLGRRQLDPSVPTKFALGVILMGSGFLVMAAASQLVARGYIVAPTWLVMTYLLHTLGELCLSPVGLSYFTKLTPKRFTGQMMGMFFLSISLGNLVAGLIAGEFDTRNVAAMPGQYLHIVYFTVGLGSALLLLSRPVKKLMGNLQ